MKNLIALDVKSLNKEQIIDDEIYSGKIISEVKDYIRYLERYDQDLFDIKKECQLNENQTHNVFRRLERTQYNVWILQYLTSFITKIPLEDEINREIVNPFEQFNTFIQHNINLLNQKDVIESVLYELKEQGLLKVDNLPKCKVWVYKKFKAILGIAHQHPPGLKECWNKQFKALKNLSSFWFFVRQQETKRIRRADILIYVLTNILIKRINRYH